MATVVSALEAYNRGRDPTLLALKLKKMQRDPFAFLRGSCHLFYASLPKRALFADTPSVWACGDLHLENCGSYRADNGQVYFDINDFDEATLAPASWDLVRVVTSLLVARRQLRISGETARSLAELLIDSYQQALSQGVARWIERETALPPVHTLLEAASRTKVRTLLARRTQGKGRRRRLRVDGEKALPASAAATTKVTKFFQQYAAPGATRPSFEVLDVALRIAGTGSLGIERYVVLVEQSGKGERPQLLDLKAALPPCAEPYPSLARASERALRRHKSVFASHAERIVRIQNRMQAIPIAWLAAVELAGAPFVLRRLLPSEDRIALAGLRKRSAEQHALLRDIGSCLAWDQLRASGRGGASVADALIEFGRSSHWRDKLLDGAQAAALRVERDHAEFARAYAEGAFDATL